MSVTLVLGGARSGKSRHAEELARAHSGRRVYIATAEAFDDEMRERIALHQRRRQGEGWETEEVPLEIAAALAAADGAKTFILVDCITLWLSNLMHADRDIAGETERLCEQLGRLAACCVLVSNEVGLGIVPENALARRFRDAQGFVNQRLAEIADDAVFLAAGLPLVLKTRSRRKPSQRATD